MANFSTPVYLMPPLNGFPLELGIGARSQKTRMTGLPDSQKSFKIGLAILIQYRRVTDTQPASQPPSQPLCRSKDGAYVHVARVKSICRPVLAEAVLGVQ